MIKLCFFWTSSKINWGHYDPIFYSRNFHTYFYSMPQLLKYLYLKSMCKSAFFPSPLCLYVWEIWLHDTYTQLNNNNSLPVCIHFIWLTVTYQTLLNNHLQFEGNFHMYCSGMMILRWLISWLLWNLTVNTVWLQWSLQWTVHLIICPFLLTFRSRSSPLELVFNLYWYISSVWNLELRSFPQKAPGHQ